MYASDELLLSASIIVFAIFKRRFVQYERISWKMIKNTNPVELISSLQSDSPLNSWKYGFVSSPSSSKQTLLRGMFRF